MGTKATFNPNTLVVEIHVGVSSINVQQDFYSDWKEDMAVGTLLAAAPSLFTESAGGNDLGAGKIRGAFFIFNNRDGWRIDPSLADPGLVITGDLYKADLDLPLFSVPTVTLQQAVDAIGISTSGSDPATVADAVLDEILSEHSGAGSFGEAIANIPANVWGHDFPGSEVDDYGNAMRLALGLLQNNFVLDETEYNTAGLLTSARIRIFAGANDAQMATDGGIGEGELAVFEVRADGKTGAAGRTKIYRTYRG
jgi:hypothetical protein